MLELPPDGLHRFWSITSLMSQMLSIAHVRTAGNCHQASWRTNSNVFMEIQNEKHVQMKKLGRKMNHYCNICVENKL